MLHVHVWGPPGAPTVLAVHGVTGHGARWRHLAHDELPGVRVLAPDLRGHGRSTAEPPWTLEQHAADLLDVLEHRGVDRALVLGHSFGGAVALHLAALAPTRVAALVLLDPATGLDPTRAGDAARDSCVPDSWPDPEGARADTTDDWDGVRPELVEEEVTEHLHRRTDGRWAWRTSAPAVVTAWSEMARAPLLPPAGVRTDVVVGAHVDPPLLDPAHAAALVARPGVTVHRFDCGHMVHQACPAETGTLVRAVLSRW